METKYDCPFYNSKGGHCEKSRRVSVWGTVTAFGCRFPKDISKCEWTKKAHECIHYNNMACHRIAGKQPTCVMFSKGICAFHKQRIK